MRFANPAMQQPSATRRYAILRSEAQEAMTVKRRAFITLVGGAVACSLAARAQQPSMPVIGFFSPCSAGTCPYMLDGLRRGLAETGYVEGRNMTIEYRWAEGRYDRLPELRHRAA